MPIKQSVIRYGMLLLLPSGALKCVVSGACFTTPAAATITVPNDCHARVVGWLHTHTHSHKVSRHTTHRHHRQHTASCRDTHVMRSNGGGPASSHWRDCPRLHAHEHQTCSQVVPTPATKSSTITTPASPSGPEALRCLGQPVLAARPLLVVGTRNKDERQVALGGAGGNRVRAVGGVGRVDPAVVE